MGKVFSKIAELSGWIFAIVGIVIPAVSVKDPQEKTIWILAIILAETIIVLIAVICSFYSRKKEYENKATERIKELENKVSAPEFTNSYVEEYDDHDKTITIRKLPIITLYEVVTICWKPTGTRKNVGYGYVSNVDALKATIKIVILFDDYKDDVLKKLNEKKRQDLLDIYILPLMYEKQLPDVVPLIQKDIIGEKQ